VFHRALELAEIQDFTWHDRRQTFAPWLMMRGTSLRQVDAGCLSCWFFDGLPQAW
jgi:hypothetical protein